MLSASLELLAQAVLYAWPWGEKRWWKLGLILSVALAVSVVISVWMAN